MSKYLEGKFRARQRAIEWQITASQTAQTWGKIAIMTCHFEKLGKRYGLLKEFRENGII